MSRTPDFLPPELLRDAAERFIHVRTAPVESDEYAEWLAWVERHPSHAAAFEQIQRAWNVTGEIKSPPWPRTEELASPPRRSFSPAFDRRPLWALAASIVVAVGAFVTFRLYPALTDQQKVFTARGEQKSTTLPDGSRIELGGQTSVSIRYSPMQRLVLAAEGEAFYNVASDPLRPFVVKAGPVTVKAQGTAFSIRHEGQAVSVVVNEGVAEVSCEGNSVTGAVPNVVRAKAGERVSFDHGKLIPLLRPVNAEQTTAWRRGRLRFEDEALRVVVATLNRYSTREIVLTDPALQELKFTGTVFDDRVEDWLAGVQVVFPVKLEDVGPTRVRIARD